ncbi:MAG: hypothetical protein HQK60_00155 [Deltaproteobacteria bacterium]|nr:hypothetical protein [Deltaproteobacteria bacterium]
MNIYGMSSGFPQSGLLGRCGSGIDLGSLSSLGAGYSQGAGLDFESELKGTCDEFRQRSRGDCGHGQTGFGPREATFTQESESVSMLAASVSQVFAGAQSVDPGTAQTEMTQAAFHRTSHEMAGLFEAIGFKPDESESYAEKIISALQNNSDSQSGAMDFSFSSGTSSDFQTAASGLGGRMSSFQHVSAMNMESLDISINSRTGEVSVNHQEVSAVNVQMNTQISSMNTHHARRHHDRGPKIYGIPEDPHFNRRHMARALNRSDIGEYQSWQSYTASLVSFRSGQIGDGISTNDPTAGPAGGNDDQLKRTLDQIVRNAGMMDDNASQTSVPQYLTAAFAGSTAASQTDQAGSPFQTAIDQIKDMARQFTDQMDQSRQIFDPFVNVQDVAKGKNDQGDDLLKLRLNVTAPVGVAQIDGSGGVTTTYQRTDGTMAKTSSDGLVGSA